MIGSGSVRNRPPYIPPFPFH